MREALVVLLGEGVEGRDNEIRSYTNRGVSVEGTGHLIVQNEIADNPLGGVLVLGGSGHVVTENHIYDNDWAGVVVNHCAFSDVYPDARALISANRIYDNGINLDDNDQDDVQLPEGFQIVGDGGCGGDLLDVPADRGERIVAIAAIVLRHWTGSANAAVGQKANAQAATAAAIKCRTVI